VEEQDLSIFNDWYWTVGQQAIDLGYTASQVRMFYADILRAFEDGLSVEDAVQEIF
jgi:hypothetical protein